MNKRTSYIVAVSGGVDSVVLMDILATGKIAHGKLIIAHFDHGIREESADDANFVRSLAKKYDVPFETKREELGPNASEELARNRRYAFLRDVAKKYGATVMTAHHADDIVETIAINIKRGTGWRGLAVLDSADIKRPLLNISKDEIRNYARKRKLEWREDATNEDTKYLRNDIRKKLTGLDPETKELLERYRKRQIVLRREIEKETARLVGKSPYPRHLFIQVPDNIAIELLRAVLNVYPTRPQLERTLLAIKTLHGGKKYEIADGVSLEFTRTHFVVSQP